MGNEQQATILVVDDEPMNIIVLSDLLKPHYRVLVARSGEQALQRIKHSDPSPDLVLLDIMMPGMDGYEVCRRLKALPDQQSALPVIFVTAMNETVDEKKGFELGAVDYITKPVSPDIVLARIHNQLELKKAYALLAEQNDLLEQRVKQRTQQLTATQDATIMALASLAETRDNETGNHIRRTQHYMRELALYLKDQPRFAAELSDENIELIYKSAPLHDIGKVGIPDHILLKPGKLTDEEFSVMKTHPDLGRDAIDLAEAEYANRDNSFLRYAREIVYTHHEKWDGTGYPQKLAGDSIPLSGRLMAVADVYDALISRRVYKPAFSHEVSVDIICQGKGSHFDPEIVDAFLALSDRFYQISQKFSDD